ncbi:MAG: YerC/YecD family TrpR-related protein [bacterium]|nr:YerC/YecD family TrpR-related protein [bacterium]
MRISRKSINKNLQKDVLDLFYQLVADLKTPSETKTFLDDVLSKSEVEAIAKRLAIANYLENNRSYRSIKDDLKVSSATIAVVDKARRSPGYQLALKKIEVEKWASDWANKISRLFSKSV